MSEKLTAVLGADKQKRVLICEDDRVIATVLRMILEQDGLEADIAYDAAQAKQMLAQHDYAAMTLDLGLPDQSGLSLIRELRSAVATANLPIIVISANADKGYKELQGEKFAVIDWISTPIEQDRWMTTLKQAILPLVVVSDSGQSRNELNGDPFGVIDWINKPINPDQLVAALKQAITQAPGKRPKVLHVEDDMDIYRLVHAVAGDFADIDNAPTLAAARRSLKDGQYDLAILDVTLPDGSGIELLRDLRCATPPIPVMVFSAQDVTMETSQKVGAVLVKSHTDYESLLATIKRMVGIE